MNAPALLSGVLADRLARERIHDDPARESLLAWLRRMIRKVTRPPRPVQ
jgi:hypothetical protein